MSFASIQMQRSTFPISVDSTGAMVPQGPSCVITAVKGGHVVTAHGTYQRWVDPTGRSSMRRVR
jgi:hypothetical protein